VSHTLALAELPASLAEATAIAGGKAANLGVMARELRLPVPPAFVITTETCRAFLAGGWPAGLDDELRARIAEVEAAVGRRFGSDDDPLLVSVRSGAPVSMPGMMDTILNLGLNDATTDGLARAAEDDALSTMSPKTRGSSSASRRKPCSDPGTVPVRRHIARRRASPTTLGPP
jgi:phosphoenolpyruvate synthase/pyruvate phosphate dikinase